MCSVFITGIHSIWSHTERKGGARLTVRDSSPVDRRLSSADAVTGGGKAVIAVSLAMVNKNRAKPNTASALDLGNDRE